jgi:hypothetical protein
MYASDFCNVRYAVIETRWVGRPAERFTVAYYSEESLRELIIGPNIIGSGFLSRQDAVALIPDSYIADPNAGSRTEADCESTENTSSACPKTAELENRFIFRRIWTLPRGLLHQLASAFVLIASSKNILSIALRAFVGI